MYRQCVLRQGNVYTVGMTKLPVGTRVYEKTSGHWTVDKPAPRLAVAWVRQRHRLDEQSAKGNR
jgi:hypothetical protein